MSYRAPSASMSPMRPMGPSQDPRVAHGGPMNPCDQLWYSTLLGYGISRGFRPGAPLSPQQNAAIAAAGRAAADQARAACLANGGALSAGGGGSGIAPPSPTTLRGLGLTIMSPAQQKAYWNARAQQCRGFADEGACLARISRHVPITIESGFGQAQTDMSPLQTLGLDRTRRVSGGSVSVDGHWAQRGVNVGHAFNGDSARMYIDGSSGPLTLAALRAMSHQFANDGAVANDPPSSRIAPRATIPLALETWMASHPLPSDPPRPASSTTTSTTTARSTTTAPSTGVKPGAGAATDTTGIVGTDPSGNPVLVDEGSSTTSPWLMPALIASGVVVAGGVGYVLWKRRGAPTANRRRKHKRSR